MIWAMAFALALAVFTVLALVLKVLRGGWTTLAAALVLGLAGFAAQSSGGQPGAPKDYRESLFQNPGMIVEVRQELLGKDRPLGSNQLVIADAMVRHGQFSDAASVLLGAVERNPRDSEAWLSLGNALVGHADGGLSPAALYAYRQSSAADPASPGAPFFLGLALAQSGRLDEGRELWAGLLANATSDAPWRNSVAMRLERLDELIAVRNAQARQSQ